VDDASLIARQAKTHRACYRMFAGASPGARVEDLDGGVQAALTPARPERSIFNAVVYDDAAALEAALPTLAAAYDGAGVRAWTVWVHPGDRAAAAALEAAGHMLDASPALMAAPLDELDLEPRVELDLDPEPTFAAAARLNDASYGIPEEASFAAALVDVSDSAARLYIARHEGRPAATVLARPEARDCGIYFVATAPEAQGRGLCSELLRQALRDAREGGCTTTSLEATKRGEPVYARLGYRALGNLEMWERRRAT
jgi:ribosomal protein S18 acetylase RimI-like enzyme